MDDFFLTNSNKWASEYNILHADPSRRLHIREAHALASSRTARARLDPHSRHGADHAHVLHADVGYRGLRVALPEVANADAVSGSAVDVAYVDVGTSSLYRNAVISSC